jgi:hypothetical protein
MLQLIIGLIAAVTALNFILIMDLMNHTSRLIELSDQATTLIATLMEEQQ